MLHLLVLVLAWDIGFALHSVTLLPRLSIPSRIYSSRTHLEQNDQDLITNKIAGWLKLKEAGALSMPNFFEDDVDRLDQLLLTDEVVKTESKTVQKVRWPPPSGAGNEQRTRVHYLLQRRVADICTSYDAERDSTGYVQGLLSVLTDLRDRGTADDLSLAESVLLRIARTKQSSPLTQKDRYKSVPQGKTAGKAPKSSTSAGNIGADVSEQHDTESQIATGLFRKQFAAYLAFLRLTEHWGVPAAHSNAVLLQYVLTLYQYSYSAATAAEQCQDDMVQRELATEAAFLPGRVCAALHQQHGPHPTGSSSAGAVTELLNAFQQSIAAYTILDVNLVLRTLARYHLAESLFSLLQHARIADVQPNAESTEILTNAFVRTVSKGQKALSMASLPIADANIPEVIFIGRSNVGKSSLVNFLLNRKALASTSATPGHTTQFHFYTINEPSTPSTPGAPPQLVAGPGSHNRKSAAVAGRGRSGVQPARAAIAAVNSHIGSADARSDVTTHLWPTLRFVDVPGMGYAESPDSAMASAAGALRGEGGRAAAAVPDRVPDGADTPEVVATGPRDRSRTWRGLLDRYLCVRDPLWIVFHLIDARHGVTPVDREVLEMVRRAQEERTELGKKPLRYTVLLTKTDKVPEGEITARSQQVARDVCAGLGATADVIHTSVVDKVGADSVWKVVMMAQ